MRLSGIAHALAAVLGVALGTFAFLFLTALFLGDPIRDTVLSAHGILASPGAVSLTPDEKHALVDMLGRGQVITSDGLISSLSSYYESVIEILVGVLAAVSVLAFMYIKSISTEKAEEAADHAVSKAVDRHFASQQFHKETADRIGDVLRPVKDSQTEFLSETGKAIEDLSERIEYIAPLIAKFDERITVIEDALASSDSEEEGGRDLKLGGDDDTA